MSELLIDTRDRVRYLTFNRPERRNALTDGLLADFFGALDDAETDESVGCIVVAGAGDAFCSGYDLDATDTGFAERTFDDELELLDKFRGFERMWHLATPIVASVHGYCLGAGTDVCFHADLTLAADDARFGYPPVRSITSPPTHMWTYLAGPQWAKRLLLTGDLISGTTAARAGFVLDAVPADELAAATHELAAKIARVPPEVAAQNKAICNRVLTDMGRDALQAEARAANATAHRSPFAAEFGRIAAAEGYKAALAWQDQHFS